METQILILNHAGPQPKSQKSFPRYKILCVAGTFDHLHGGHKALLSIAALCTAEHLVVGLLSNAFFSINILASTGSKKLSNLIETIEDRKLKIANFLLNFVPNLKFSVETISRCPSIKSCSLISGNWKDKVEAMVCENEPESIEGASKIAKTRE